MKAQINVISGGPAGTVHVFSKSEVSIGRHPQCDIQFDPQDDLQVSIRHAVLVRTGDRWAVRDLQSSNGTFVNGHQITADTQLDTTDQIRLGRNGPLLEFKLVHEGTDDTQKPVTARPKPARPRTTDGGHPAPARRSNTEHRVRVEVAKQTRRLRTGLFVLAFVLVGVLAGATYVTDQQRARRDAQVAALQAQIDSVLTASDQVIRDLQGQVTGLEDAIQTSRLEMRALTNQLERARAAGNNELIASLTSQLATARAELNQRQSAARIDYPSIRRTHQRAVAIVRVKHVGQVGFSVGTAFAISRDGLMITNHHVVAGANRDLGIQEMGVQFADSPQFFPARLVRAPPSDGVDLALIQVRLGSAPPFINSFNARPDTIPVGAPAAVIGFPLGDDLPMQESEFGTLASTSLTAGLLSKNIPGQLQLDGFGAPGGSGSPIFDAHGEVIGVVYSGIANQDLVFAIPSDMLLRFIDGGR